MSPITPQKPINSYKELMTKCQCYCRVLLTCSAGAAILSYGLPYHSIDINGLVLAIILLMYSGFTYWYTLHIPHHHKRIITWLPMTDGFFILLAISELNYNLWPSLLLMGLLQFNALFLDDNRPWLTINIGAVIGLTLGYFLLGNQVLDLKNHQTLNVVAVITTFAYLTIYGRHAHNYQQKLQSANEHFRQNSEDYRSYAYKLARYLPAPVSAILRGQDYQLKTERKRITVFFSDIVGFTELSEELEAETLSELLNSYLSEMSIIANKFNGTVDKFMGDAIMVLFGDDEEVSKGVKKDAIQCVSMAIDMAKAMRELQPQWAELGIKKPLEIRIGINSGYCTVGTFGTHKNLDYTALGAHVNLASRLESAGKPGSILISHETWALVKDIILCRDKGQIKAKGFSHPIQVYEVVDHRRELGGNQSYLSENLTGFSMHLDMEKIKNYHKDKVINTLETAAKKLRNKHIP